jgi:hypothetical protein
MNRSDKNDKYITNINTTTPVKSIIIITYMDNISSTPDEQLFLLLDPDTVHPNLATAIRTILDNSSFEYDSELYGIKYFRTIMVCSARKGCVSSFQMLFDHFQTHIAMEHFPVNACYDYAGYGGSLDIIKFLFERNILPDRFEQGRNGTWYNDRRTTIYTKSGIYDIFEGIIMAGQVEILTFMHEIFGYDSLKETYMNIAVKYGVLSCMIYLHEKCGIPFDKDTVMTAINRGHHDCMIYAHQMGSRLPPIFCVGRYKIIDNAILEYLTNHGCVVHFMK